MNIFQYLSHSLRGDVQTLKKHREALASYPDIMSGLSALTSACPPTVPDDDSPIFLLSAGWRSGSTFLQRLIMSDPDVLLWGEPYDECGPIQALARTVEAFRSDWPPREYFFGTGSIESVRNEWIANLFPSLEDWRYGHRAFFDSMLAAPARRAGAKRWGVKEVRLSSEHAHYLRWVYPDSVFVFLVRNPLDAYRSYSRWHRSWYKTWPHEPVFTARQFGAHWRDLAKGFLRERASLGALLIRYEDVAGSEPQLREIETFLGLRIDRSIIRSKVGSSRKKGEQPWVSRLDKWLLEREVGSVAKELGYEV